MQLVKISSKGQITIPKRVLLSLGLGPRDKLLIENIGDALLIKGVSSSIVEETFGSLARYVPSSKRNKSFVEIMQGIKKTTAKKLAKNL